MGKRFRGLKCLVRLTNSDQICAMHRGDGGGSNLNFVQNQISSNSKKIKFHQIF